MPGLRQQTREAAKNIEWGRGVDGDWIVASTPIVEQIAGKIVFPLRKSASAAGQAQVHFVREAGALRHSCKSAYRNSPIVETLGIPDFHRPPRQDQRHCNYDRHVSGCAYEES